MNDETASVLTMPGAVIGTLPYMSPEQAEGKPIDARSDVFSFGSVLYEMLSGKRAFPAQTRAALLSAVMRDDPKPLSEERRRHPSRSAPSCFALLEEGFAGAIPIRRRTPG